MNTRPSTARPPLAMIDHEADILTTLAERTPALRTMLLAEIERATLHDAAAIPRDVVTMNATIDFTDDANGSARTVQLVYPADADFEAGRISIMTPVGIGLIGLREGQSIVWPDRDGRERRLTVTRVEQAPQQQHA